jgi:hypothetical protein
MAIVNATSASVDAAGIGLTTRHKLGRFGDDAAICTAAAPHLLRARTLTLTRTRTLTLTLTGGAALSN